MAQNGEANLLIRIKEEGIKALGDVAVGLDEIKVKAGIASAAITAFIGLSIREFIKAEKSTESLNNAIRNQGLDVDRLSEKYSNLAKEIQKKSEFDDDQIKSGIAIAQSLVGHLELTDRLIQATVDYAASNSIDLNTAFNMVGKTIGTNTNALARQGIEIQENATKTEKLAIVTRALESRAGGAAEVLGNTLGGSLSKLKNQFGDLLEIIGQQFSPLLNKLSNLLTNVVVSLQTNEFARWTAVTLSMSAAITGFVAALGTLVGLVPSVVTGLSLIRAGFTFMLGPIGLVLTSLSALLVAFETNFLNIGQILTNFVTSTASLLKSLFTVDLNGFQASVNSMKRIFKDGLDDQIKASEEKNKKEILDAKAAAEAKKRFAAQKAAEALELDKKRFDEKLEYEKSKREAELEERIRIAQAIEDAEKERIAAWAHGIEYSISGGFQKLASQTLSYFSDQFLQGIGGAIGAVFNFLSQDTDQFKEQLNKLFGPEFIDNILKNLTTLVEELPAILDRMINYLSENMPAITESLIKSIIANLPNIVASFAQAWIKMMSNPRFLADMAAAITKGFIGGFESALDKIAEGLKKAVKDAFSGIVNIGGSGGIGGIVEGAGKFIGGAFGFSRGGLIPGYASGGLIDNQLIRAHAGEFVTNKDSTSANMGLLTAINNSNGRSVSSGNTIVINVNGGLLGDRQSAQEFARAIDEELYRLRLGNESRAFDRSLT